MVMENGHTVLPLLLVLLLFDFFTAFLCGKMDKASCAT